VTASAMQEGIIPQESIWRGDAIRSLVLLMLTALHSSELSFRAELRLQHSCA
jgi:hypothetical protein